jgi:rubrerythrin
MKSDETIGFINYECKKCGYSWNGYRGPKCPNCGYIKGCVEVNEFQNK